MSERGEMGIVGCFVCFCEENRVTLHYWWELGGMKNKNKLVERKAFVDTVGIESADLKDTFFI